MKIGILTWFFGCNYGAKAHSYALQQVLLSMGHDCEFVGYYPQGYKLINFKMNLDKNHRERSAFKTINGIKRVCMFEKTNSLYNIGRIVRCAEEIDALHYDVVILGSDEIFNVKHPLYSEVYFGVGINTPKITYAPSSGYVNMETVLEKSITDSLLSIKNILVRDFHTKRLIENNINKEAEVVLDPTLLYNFTKIQKTIDEEDYILIYTFSKWDEYSEKIRQYASLHNLKLISVGRYCEWADYSYDTICFEKWLGAFVKAKTVITDSFHGAIFAIKNRKNIILLGREDKKNKIMDLFLEFGVKKDFYDENQTIEEYLNGTYNCAALEAQIETKKKKSYAFLKQALEEAGNE